MILGIHTCDKISHLSTTWGLIVIYHLRHPTGPAYSPLASLHSLQSNESSIQPYESCLQSNFTGSIFAYLSCVQLLPNKLRLLLYPVPADSLSVNIVIKTVILWQRYTLPGQELGGGGSQRRERSMSGVLTAMAGNMSCQLLEWRHEGSSATHLVGTYGCRWKE